MYRYTIQYNNGTKKRGTAPDLESIEAFINSKTVWASATSDDDLEWTTWSVDEDDEDGKGSWNPAMTNGQFLLF